jgi:hypothetical protein
MPILSLKAHFDGKRICLDEPFKLPANAPLLVTILPVEGEAERHDWLQASAVGLARAYGDHEPEYSEAEIINCS